MTASFSPDVIDSLPAQIALVDAKGEILTTNRAWKEVAAAGGLGTRRAGERWNYFEECRAAENRGCAEAVAVARSLELVLSRAESVAVVTYPCPWERQFRWYQAVICRSEDQKSGGALVVHFDVTALQHDPLTGIPNRALYKAQIAYLIAQAQASGTTLGTILLDLERFKQVNDVHGRQVGDKLLIQVARRLQRAVHEGDLVTRLGGESSRSSSERSRSRRMPRPLPPASSRASRRRSTSMAFGSASVPALVSRCRRDRP